jgi:nitrous oxidase accessory protein
MAPGRRARWRGAVAGGLAAALAASAGSGEPGAARPAGCRSVAPGAPLAEAVAAAPEGTALYLAPGVHDGPLRIDRRLFVFGPREAVILSRGSGSTVSLEAAGSALVGVTVDGSGGRFDLLDAAVAVHADDVRVEGVRVVNALFGILAERARRVTLRDNEVEGQPGKPFGLRGDGIRLWEVRESLVEGNRLSDGRDLVVWYAPRNRIARNRVERGRYGTHLMYSPETVAEDNRYLGNVVGIFVMYSRDVVVHRNFLVGSRGAAGVGLGAKDSGNLSVEENWIVANHTGIYLDTSPLYLDEENRFARNALQLCETAVAFHGGSARNRFEDNRFRDNGLPVRTEGGGDAREAVWLRNEWDDYAGYDLDGDGFGDVAYELRSLGSQLVARHPELAFLRGTAALSLAELVGRVVPLFEPTTLLVDPEPRTTSVLPEAPRAR